MTAARPAARVAPPAGTDDDADLSPAERAKCATRGVSTTAYLATRAGIRARNAGASQ
jgi:hypothetical protein